MKTNIILLSLAASLSLSANTVTSVATVETSAKVETAPAAPAPIATAQVSVPQTTAAPVAVFFTARSVSDHTRHEATVSQQATGSVQKAQAEQGVISDAGVTSTASITATSQASVSQQTINKSDEVGYQLDHASREEFGTALFDYFAAHGFDSIIDGAFFDESALLDDAYGQGNVVPASIWRKIVKGLQSTDSSIEYLVVGTLDFGIPYVDPSLNLWAVDATVSGRVYRLGGGVPRLVAALAPQTHKARAKDQLQSKKRALEGISRLAAEEVINKLKAKKIIP